MQRQKIFLEKGFAPNFTIEGGNTMEATGGFEPPNEGFAGPCLTTWLRRQRG